MKLALPFVRFSLPVVPFVAILTVLGLGLASKPEPAADPVRWT